MEIRFNEQDVIDSVCVYIASTEETTPEEVDVDLRFNQTISALAVYNRFEKKYLNEQDIIDAIAIYLREYHSFNPYDLRIDLLFSEREGIGANIIVN